MEIPVTLHVARDGAQSQIMTAGYGEAIAVAAEGERCGMFRAEFATDWCGGKMDEATLRREIERRH
jgi:hypothetical protein